MTDREQIYKAWQAVGADLAGLKWDDFVAALAQPEQELRNLFEAFEQYGEGWERLAWELCADEHGEEACTELIWEGGPIPVPWGVRWLKYEDEAKRLISLVHKHTTPPQRKPLTDEEIDALPLPPSGTATVRDLVRIIEAAHGIKGEA